jgi:FlaG/FlaF family flagellin (archaellin)
MFSDRQVFFVEVSVSVDFVSCLGVSLVDIDTRSDFLFPSIESRQGTVAGSKKKTAHACLMTENVCG